MPARLFSSLCGRQAIRRGCAPSTTWCVQTSNAGLKRFAREHLTITGPKARLIGVHCRTRAAFADPAANELLCRSLRRFRSNPYAPRHVERSRHVCKNPTRPGLQSVLTSRDRHLPKQLSAATVIFSELYNLLEARPCASTRCAACC